MNSLGLWTTAAKCKDQSRHSHVNRLYAQNQMQHSMIFWLKRDAENPGYIKECLFVSADCASTKKIGTRESNNDTRNKRKVILTEDMEIVMYSLYLLYFLY